MAENNRKLISATNAAFAVLIALGIAVALNAVASQAFGRVGRIDMTENKIYTLSDASVEAVSKLEKPVEVKAFISSDMPPPFHKLSEQVADILAEYAAASNGKLTYQIINPKDDEETEEAAKGFGIEKVGIGQQTEDEVSLRAVYKGIAFIQGEQTEVIKDLQTSGNPETDNFEYQFTKALLNIQNPEPRTIGVVSGYGGPAAQPQFVQQLGQIYKQLYGKLIKVESVDLSTPEAKVPDTIHALVLLNVEEKFSSRALFAINQYLQKGGSVAWLQSSSGPDMQLMQQLAQQMGGRLPPGMTPPRKKFDPGLNDLFGTYGAKINDDYIIDRKHGLSMVPIQTERGLALVSHPAAFQLTDIDHELPFSRNLYAMAMAVPSSIMLTNPGDKEKTGVEVTQLIATSSDAVRRSGMPPSKFEDFIEPDPKKKEEAGPFLVAAVLQGKLPSHFEAGEAKLPDGVKKEDLVKDSKPARVVIFSSGDFWNPQPNYGYDQRASSMGIQMMLASFEWLVQDTRLTEIKGKSLPRIIGEVPKDEQNRIQFINILFVPSIFALLGVLMLGRRRRRKEKLSLD